jgi:hypothetical protein
LTWGSAQGTLLVVAVANVAEKQGPACVCEV